MIVDLPVTQHGGKLRLALEEAGIEYTVIKLDSPASKAKTYLVLQAGQAGRESGSLAIYLDSNGRFNSASWAGMSYGKVAHGYTKVDALHQLLHHVRHGHPYRTEQS